MMGPATVSAVHANNKSDPLTRWLWKQTIGNYIVHILFFFSQGCCVNITAASASVSSQSHRYKAKRLTVPRLHCRLAVRPTQGVQLVFRMGIFRLSALWSHQPSRRKIQEVCKLCFQIKILVLYHLNKVYGICACRVHTIYVDFQTAPQSTFSPSNNCTQTFPLVQV